MLELNNLLLAKTSVWQDDGGNAHYILTCAWDSD
jgi:hypothetical protein